MESITELKDSLIRVIELMTYFINLVRSLPGQLAWVVEMTVHWITLFVLSFAFVYVQRAFMIIFGIWRPR